jgi:DNA-binding GntR family transcriptional regulator
MSQVVLAEELGVSRTPLRMTPEDIARLEGSIAEMAHLAEARDVRRWLVPHGEYHPRLTMLAGALLADPA